MRRFFIVVLVVFGVAFSGFLGVMFGEKLFVKERFDKEDLGVINGNVQSKTGVNELDTKRKTLFVESTGKVEEEGTASVVEFQFNDKNGKLVTLKSIVQIKLDGGTFNEISWFVTDAQRIKENKTGNTSFLSKSELTKLYNKGSKWILVPLLRSNLEDIRSQFERIRYMEIANRYYVNEDWEALEKSFENDFVDFNFPKPIFVLRLAYIDNKYEE
jgi:hypothetical protein